MRLPPDLPDLPVRGALDAVTGALTEHGTAVLVAPPGTGKTTLVPLALGAENQGKVLVAEPRRLAARAAAAWMAGLLGEPVGQTVGYSVRGDSRTSARTQVEVVTSGLLLRRLANDPELTGVAAVLLDECHERHLDADLLLALLLDARAGLRPDLRLLATSATVATGRLAAILGGGLGGGMGDGDPAPVLEVAARMFPVSVAHLPPARGERIEACVARAVRTALAEAAGEDDGDVLAFLPGVAEIRRAAAALSGVDADVLALHGRLPAGEQDAALRRGPRRRVVLATAVAESSLTVPGVRAVVDAGLARTPRVDHRAGVGRGGRAAGWSGRSGGPGVGVPLLAGERAAAPLPGAGDPHRRPHPARPRPGLLGHPRRRRPALVGPASGGSTARRPGGASGARCDRRRRRSHRAGSTDGRSRPAPPVGPRPARRCGAGRHPRGGRGSGAAGRRHAHLRFGRRRRAGPAAVRRGTGGAAVAGRGLPAGPAAGNRSAGPRRTGRRRR